MTRVSRSAIQTRKQCEMKRYRMYEFRQSGLVPQEFVAAENGVISMAQLPAVRGQIFHTAALSIVEGKDWLENLNRESTKFPDHIRHQQTALIRRAMLGWHLIRGPWWREHFDVVSAEQAWTWPLTPEIVEPLRMDNVLARKSDGALGILDYKTLSSVDPNWPLRMEMSDQSHLYIQALKERTDKFILGICYEGVLIGKWKNGQQRSPFTLGFKKFGKISPKWSQGSEDVDLTQWTDDEWMGWIGAGLKDLYYTTTFLHPPNALLLHTKTSTGRAEEEWKSRVELLESIRRLHGEDSAEFTEALGLVEKNSDQCFKYGVDYACPFVRQCWQGHQWDEFVPRQDHHAEGEDE